MSLRRNQGQVWKRSIGSEEFDSNCVRGGYSMELVERKEAAMYFTDEEKESDHYSQAYLEIPAFGFLIAIIIVETWETWNKNFGFIQGPASSTAAAFVQNWGDSNACVYAVFRFSEMSPNTIAHEAWHVVRKMLISRGAELDNEVVAYHVGFIAGEITKFRAMKEAFWTEKEKETSTHLSAFSRALMGFKDDAEHNA
jgi:hypothetical protein